MACARCGGWVQHWEIPEFRDDARVGLPGVVLVNAVTETVCTECHDGYFTIPNLAGAIAAAGIARVKHRDALTGAELRALRRAAGLTAKALADLLGVGAETVSRWETGAEPIADEGLARRALGTAFDPAFDDVNLVYFQSFDARRSDGPPEIRLEWVPVGHAATEGEWKPV